MAASPGTPFQLVEATPFQTGQSLPGAKLYFYETGTTTDQAVYTTPALAVTHSQPVEADSDGFFPAIYLNSGSGLDYRARLTTAADVQVWQYDNVQRYVENFDTDTFECTYTGFSADPAGTTATWYRFGRLIQLSLPIGTGTSNSTSFGIAGLPASIRPTTTQYCHVPFATDNSGAVAAGAIVSVTSASSMTIALNTGAYSATSWTGSGTKGLTTDATIWYRVEDA